LLLGHAVEGAEAPDEIAAVDGDDWAVGDELFEDFEGEGVVGVVEDGDEDAGVGDVEVGVGGGEALAFEDDGGREGEFGDGELFILRVAHFFEAFEVFFHGGVVGVGWVGFDAGEEGGGVGEAGGVVDVAVGVVAGDALVEPEDFGGAEVGVEGLFDFLAGEVGVALLDGGEEAFFGGEDAAGAVDVDGAAFEDEALEFLVVVFAVGGEAGEVELVGDGGGESVVEGVVVVFGPGVEFEIDEGCGIFHFGLCIVHLFLEEDGAGVAGPDAVGGLGVEGDVSEVDVVAFEDFFDVFGEAVVFGRLDEDVDAFGLGEEADDFGIDPGDGFEFVGPVFVVVGPGDPGGFVGGPFGRHGVAEGGGGLIEGRFERFGEHCRPCAHYVSARNESLIGLNDFVGSKLLLELCRVEAANVLRN
jgi:hypothetical protein